MLHWIIEDTIVGDGKPLRLRIRELSEGQQPDSMGFIHGPFTSGPQAEAERERLVAIREREGWDIV